ncbi:uncharacterized protein LOC118193730 isoform X2 [Stegodyphus dumicola]|uniref:uncharacterized protein LOC118193730 isoform X2 n=1 Tax=Stegodyphus dumicola TaxID=202533 RepID=UPI0015AA4158|nr:uncharacterized protein LOC118193730 isoform X2 [Stegodyphus dumicola]
MAILNKPQESKLENSNKILSEKIDKKISYEEFNIQLETVVRKLQELEKMFKAYSTEKITQDFDDIRPIQVRHYIQGKGSSRFLSACKRITSPDKVISELSDCYFQELVPNEIQKQVQKKMEKATFRESTHYISGAHTKLQRKRN